MRPVVPTQKPAGLGIPDPVGEIIAKAGKSFGEFRLKLSPKNGKPLAHLGLKAGKVQIVEFPQFGSIG